LSTDLVFLLEQESLKFAIHYNSIHITTISNSSFSISQKSLYGY